MNAFRQQVDLLGHQQAAARMDDNFVDRNLDSDIRLDLRHSNSPFSCDDAGVDRSAFSLCAICRIAISQMADWATPQCAARASTSRFASGVRRRLVCFFCEVFMTLNISRSALYVKDFLFPFLQPSRASDSSVDSLAFGAIYAFLPAAR